MRARTGRLDYGYVPHPADSGELPWLVRQAFIRTLRSRVRAFERMALVHDVANSLNVITANLEALRVLQTDPEAIEMLADMTIAAERLIRGFEALRRRA